MNVTTGQDAMSADDSIDITRILNEVSAGNSSARDKLARLVYQDLKRIAANRLRTESKNNTLTVTALVHEAFMRLDSTRQMSWQSRRHYFGAAAEAMRRILIDRARYHQRQRREGDKKAIPLDDGLQLEAIAPRELIALNDALSDLQQHDAQLAELVKLKYFVGLSIAEIAELLETSSRTVDRRWQAARAWLLMELGRV